MRNTSSIVWELSRKKEYAKLYEKLESENLKKFQNELIKILFDFHKFCQKYNLEYAIVAGTLIGAKRHKGFIPWDDDIDVVMPRKDYEKLCKLELKEEFSKYKFEDSRESEEVTLCGKFKNKNLTYFKILGGNYSKTKHIYIDVLPVDYVPKSKIKKFFIGKLINMLIKSFTSLRCLKKNDLLINEMAKKNSELKMNLILRKICCLPSLVIGKNNTIKLIHKLLINKEETAYSTIALGVKGYFGEIIQSEDFFPSKSIEFENYLVKGPQNAESYLTNRYGNYMEIPPLKEQEERLVRLKDNWKEIYYDKCSNGNI